MCKLCPAAQSSPSQGSRVSTWRAGTAGADGAWEGINCLPMHLWCLLFHFNWVCVCGGWSCVWIWGVLAGWGSAQLMPGCAWRTQQQKHSAATRASLVPGSGTLKLLLICSSRTQIQFHSFITKSKSVSPFQAQSNGKRPSWHLRSALMRVTLPQACPGGNSCHEPSSTQVLLPFFQTFPQPHLPTTADAHWQ